MGVELFEPGKQRLRDVIGFPLVDADIAVGANINANKIGTGVVDNTEFDRLNGITSAIEEQGNKGAISGYAGLDASQELLLTNFPAGTGLQVLRRNAGNTALEFAAHAGEFFGPWTADHNAGGFDLLNVGGIQINNPADTFQYIITPSAIIADRTVTFPLLTTNGNFVITGFADQITNTEIAIHTSTKITITAKGQLNSNIVYTDQANTFGAFAQRFPTTQLQLDNPAGTFQYIFATSAIAADRTVTLPLLIGNDILVFESHIQTLVGKTLTTPTIASFVNATHDHSNVAGGGNLTNTALTTGVFAAITGIGIQTQDFDLSTNFMDIGEIVTPANPSANVGRLYVKDLATVTTLFFRDSAGAETNVLTGSEVVTWTADHDAAGFDLLNVGGIQINNPADTFQYIITPAAIAADRILNLPLMTGTDIIALEAFAATLTNKTMTAGANTFSGFAIGTEVTGASTDLTDTGVIVLTNQANIFGDFDQTFKDNRLRIENPAGTFEVQLQTSAEIADRVLTIPLLGGNRTIIVIGLANQIGDTEISAHTSTKITITAKGQLNGAIVFNDQANIFGDFDQTFKDNRLRIENPAGTFEYQITAGAIAADRILNLPVTLATDTIMTLGLAQTVSGALTLSAILTMSAVNVDLAGNDLDNIQNLIHDISTSGTDVDFNEDQLQTISISANTTFTGVNYATGKSKTIFITTDGTLRTLTFPAGWKFQGPEPADQAASKVGTLTLTCTSGVEAGIRCAYAVEE